MIVEEFAPEFLHIAGEKNVIVDALCRLDLEYKESDIKDPDFQKDLESEICLANEELTNDKFPVSLKELHQLQQKDAQAMRRPETHKT